MPELLLEIGCEELPAPWLPGLGAQLGESFETLAGGARLDPARVEVRWTPRRLALRAALAERQPDVEERLFGPSLGVARDASGKWTKAAQGFARKHGVSPDALEQEPRDDKSPGELYLVHVKKSRGRAAAELLPDLLARVLRGLAFPKRMSWDAWLDDGKGAFPFGRPIRWLVLLLDGEVVPFTVHVLGSDGAGDAPVASGALTRGHRFLPSGEAGTPLRVRAWSDYQAGLRERFVVVDPGERTERIRRGLEAAAGGGQVAASEALLEEWRDLVEFPTVVRGAVPPELRRLPGEVLRTVLVHHQKYAPVVDAGGVVTHFAAVTNAAAEAAPAIVRGMERVVVARLRDAAFFFDEDRKRPLESRVADLAGVTLHRGLGSYAEKAERVAALVETRAAESLPAEEVRDAARAARLAKADLTTLMVGEFPELQGVMGGLYLEAGGEPADVAAAVRWHYHPLSAEEQSEPAGRLGGRAERLFAAVSLADKLDTLAGYFGLGLAPTGSRDPFGLRRAGQGAVRVLLDFRSASGKRPPPDLRRWVAAAVEGQRAHLKRSEAEVVEELCGFLVDRLRYVLGARGYPADEVEAVLGAREPDALEDVKELRARIEALHRVRSEAREDFDHLAVAFKRAKNILADTSPGKVDPGAFEEEAERELHAAVERLSGRDGGYEAKLRSLAGLRGPVDRFFDDVLVMTDDRRLRENRQAVLGTALALFYRIADISRLGG